jgi:hypothetical protein
MVIRAYTWSNLPCVLDRIVHMWRFVARTKLAAPEPGRSPEVFTRHRTAFKLSHIDPWPRSTTTVEPANFVLWYNLRPPIPAESHFSADKLMTTSTFNSP